MSIDTSHLTATPLQLATATPALRVRVHLHPFDLTYRQNPYYPLFHAALSSYGFDSVGRLEVGGRWLSDVTQSGDLLLFHWGVENVWRYWGRRPDTIGQSRGLFAFWRFLRSAKRRGLRIGWMVHDLQPHERWTVFERLGYRLLAQAADVCGLHSHVARDKFIERYPHTANRCVVFPLGNYDGYYPQAAEPTAVRASFGVPVHARLLVACGMVTPYKGFETAMDAMGMLPTGYHLLVAGHPNNRAYAATLRDRAAGRANVTFLDRSLTEQEFADIYTAADCVLLPYHRITGSAALLAACTFSRGVVASDLPYFRELLASEPMAGVLCRPNDATELARGVEQFFGTDTKSRHEAARRIADQYPWDDSIRPFADRLLTVLQATAYTPEVV